MCSVSSPRQIAVAYDKSIQLEGAFAFLPQQDNKYSTYHNMENSLKLNKRREYAAFLYDSVNYRLPLPLAGLLVMPVGLLILPSTSSSIS